MEWKVSNLGTSSSTTRKFPTNVSEFFSEQGNTGSKTNICTHIASESKIFRQKYPELYFFLEITYNNLQVTTKQYAPERRDKSSMSSSLWFQLFALSGLERKDITEEKEWFIDGQAFSRAYNLAPPPPPSPIDKLDQATHRKVEKEIQLADRRSRGGGGRGAKHSTANYTLCINKPKSFHRPPCYLEELWCMLSKSSLPAPDLHAMLKNLIHKPTLCEHIGYSCRRATWPTNTKRKRGTYWRNKM